jgi:hypothetical protein
MLKYKIHTIEKIEQFFTVEAPNEELAQEIASQEYRGDPAVGEKYSLDVMVEGEGDWEDEDA